MTKIIKMSVESPHDLWRFSKTFLKYYLNEGHFCH
jgi:hypothetical protein